MQVVELNDPPVVPAFSVKVIVPEGTFEAVVVSTTDAVQEDVCPTFMDPGLQDTFVDVLSLAAPIIVTE